MLQTLHAGDYFGVTRPLWADAGLSLAQTTFSTPCVIPLHQHENPFFCLVLSGTGTRRWQAAPGAEAQMALTAFPAEVPHANRWYSERGQCLHIEFSPAWCERMREARQVLAAPLDFSGGPALALAQRIAAESHQRDAASPLILEGLILELIGQCLRQGNAGRTSVAPAWLAQLRDLLHDRFMEGVSLSALAAEQRVSADYLARAFRRHFGCTVGDYVRQLRIEAACTQLINSSLPLSEIAIALGFADQAHFSRVFKQVMKISPRAFRLSAQPGRNPANEDARVQDR
jgi:AraC-like DNA-binding protein